MLTEGLRRYLPEWSWMVWLGGAAAMAGYGIYGCIRMCYLVRDAVPESLKQRKIWYSDRIQSPFILGILRPRIYLPCKMEGEVRECVLAHEQAHLIRRDPVTKLIGYALLAVYWFQPLIWVAYVLLCQDIEQACDERVIRSYGMDIRRKRSYMDALLTVSTRGAILAGGVLGFGKDHVRQRIGNLLHYKRPAAWVVGISVLLCAAAVFFLTNPHREDETADNVTVTSEEQENIVTDSTPTPSEDREEPSVENMADASFWKEAQDIPELEQANLVALPMGRKVKVDLDGDGEKELLQITVNNQGSMAQLNNGDWRFAEAVIRVGQQTYDPEVFFDNLDLCTWYLFRIGGDIPGWQIGLYEDGPSADPGTHLFAYEEIQGSGRLVHLGAFPDYPIQDIYPGYSWERGGREPVNYMGQSYQEVLEQVDRSIGSWMRVPGDGSISATCYMDILQSEPVVGQWRLDEISENGLKMQEQSQYEFWNRDNPYMEESAHRTLEEIYVYLEPDTEAETAVIPADQAVVFLTYDPENKWIRIGYNQGENTGFILADHPYASILLAPGPDDGTEPVSRIPADIFSGLYLVP